MLTPVQHKGKSKMLERSPTFPITALGSVSYESRCNTITPASCCWRQSRATTSQEDFAGPSPKMTRAVSRAYVRGASQGLNFSEDVVKQRCPDKLSYKPSYFLEAVDVSRVLTPRPPRKPRGRCGASGHVTPHEPCCLTNRIMCPRRLTPLDCRKPPRQPRRKKPKEPVDPICKMVNWDVYTMSLLSKCTAEWIINVLPGENRRELSDYVTARYGTMLSETDLTSPNASIDVTEEMPPLLSEPRKWKKDGDNMLDKVRKLVAAEETEDDPSSMAFYRLPAGIRRAKKAAKLEEDEALNQSAQNIVLPPRRETETHIQSLRDYINPAVGSKIFDTTNPFQQERLIGLQQVRDKRNLFDDIIITESDSRYRKQLQQLLPRPPDRWSHQEDPGNNAKRVLRRMVGTQKWQDLPQLIMPYNVNIIDPFTYNCSNTTDKAEFEEPSPRKVQNTQDVAVVSQPTSESKSVENNKLNNSLIAIVDDWRTKWSLDMRYADATPEDLIRDMADLQLHVRLKAITTCARAAEYRPPPQPGISLDVQPTNQVSLLPENLFVALECCLKDNHEQVRRAAAIALYTLERPTVDAEQELRHSLLTAASVDRWAAAQCLAFYGECDSDVVGELISQLMTTELAVRHEQAAHLLAMLSESSTLVHSMIGEQLNSSSWRERVMACRMLPRLSGSINKDLVSKMLQLLWCDWHYDVRHAAGQALGRTAHGRHVHDSLLEQLDVGNEKTKLLAINHIGCLGIMTAKLLPAFLECFDSSYVSIRKEVCIAAARLRIEDENVLAKLVQLSTFDSVWKVKAAALQAVSSIGVLTPEIRSCVLWAFRYEGEEGVRAQACRCIVDLRINDEQTAQALQDRNLVEESEIVKKEIRQALGICNISPSEDIAMVMQIKNEVRKLSTVSNIFKHIVLHEKDLEKLANLERLVKEPKEQSRKSRHPTQKIATLSPYTDLEQQAPSKQPSHKSTPRSEQSTPVQIHREPILSPLRVVKHQLSPVREKSAAERLQIKEDECSTCLGEQIEDDQTIREEEDQTIGEERSTAEDQQASSESRATAMTFTPTDQDAEKPATPRLSVPASARSASTPEPSMERTTITEPSAERATSDSQPPASERSTPTPHSRYLLADELPTRTPACGYVPPASTLAPVVVAQPDNSDKMFALCMELAKDYTIENAEFDATAAPRETDDN